MDEKTKKNAIYIKAALSGVAVGLVIFMMYLFAERDSRAGEDYRQYYAPLVKALENFKTNLASLYGRAEELAGSTAEASLEQKREFIEIVRSNIRQCDASVKSFDDTVAPMSARKTRNDMIDFFNSARSLLVRLEKTVDGKLKNGELAAELAAIEDDLEKLSRKQISGFTYY